MPEAAAVFLLLSKPEEVEVEVVRSNTSPDQLSFQVSKIS